MWEDITFVDMVQRSGPPVLYRGHGLFHVGMRGRQEAVLPRGKDEDGGVGVRITSHDVFWKQRKTGGSKKGPKF